MRGMGTLETKLQRVERGEEYCVSGIKVWEKQEKMERVQRKRERKIKEERGDLVNKKKEGVRKRKI